MNANLSFGRRSTQVLLAGLAILAITACQDAVAPRQLSAPKHAAFLRYQSGSNSFTYTPGEGAFATVGSFTVYIPKGAVCDPSTSSYGPGTWNDACSPAQTPITITATTYVNANGLPFVQFEPELRFSPNAGPVWLYLYDKRVSANRTSNILYCTDDGACINEAASDPSLALHFVTKYDYVYRRLKHFSGYNVTAGYTDSTATTSSSFAY